MSERYKKFEVIKVSELVEETALKAVEMTEFREIMKTASSGVEAIRAVREKLREVFPEIEKIPAPEPAPGQKPIGGLPSNEFLIAKEIVKLLGK